MKEDDQFDPIREKNPRSRRRNRQQKKQKVKKVKKGVIKTWIDAEPCASIESVEIATDGRFSMDQ